MSRHPQQMPDVWFLHEKKMRNKLLELCKKDNIRGARHLPRILRPVAAVLPAIAIADLFHAALRSCSNLFLVKGLAALRRPTVGEADG